MALRRYPANANGEIKDEYAIDQDIQVRRQDATIEQGRLELGDGIEIATGAHTYSVVGYILFRGKGNTGSIRNLQITSDAHYRFPLGRFGLFGIVGLFFRSLSLVV